MEMLGKQEATNLLKENVGKWSALQHCFHLHLAEKGSLAYVKKKLSYSPKLKGNSVQRFLKNSALKLFMFAPIKLKAPVTIDESSFPKELSLDKLRIEWGKSRKELETFLSESGEKYKNLEVYRHPMAGRLTLDGMLLFFELHQKRHMSKIAKSLSLMI
jgi:hypothetical protein